jgi:subtilisin family serine protease
MKNEAHFFGGTPVSACTQGSRYGISGTWSSMFNMKHIALFLFSVLILISPAIGQSNEPAFVEGQVLVQIRQGYDLKAVSQAMNQQFGPGIRMRSTRELSSHMGIWLLEYNADGVDAQEVLKSVKFHDAVIAAQLNHIMTNRLTTPNDPQFGQQWQYINTGAGGGVVDADIDADQAWDITTGGLTPFGDTIVVCVVDDGLDASHQDFGDNIWVNYAEIPNNNIDDDGNGYVDDRRGWNAYGGNDNIYLGGGHGTPVAGIVGAKGNNGIGVSGVNWNVKLMIVRGGGNEAEAIAAYDYPLSVRKQWNQSGGQSGAFVVATNSSWGVDFGQPSQAPLWCAMYDTLGKYGILNCGATINNNTNVDVAGDLPTACPSDYMIAVTNMNRSDVKVTSAGYGPITIDLGAHGQDTYTAANNNSYGGFGGTSGATPHVTGAIGLLYSAPCPAFALYALSHPDSAALLMRQFILDGVDPNASLQGITTTGGRLNLYNSLQEVLNWGCSSGGCYEAYGLNAANVIDTSAVLSWNAISSVDSFLIEIRPVGAATWTSYADTSRALALSNLAACTEYEYRVLAYCDTTSTNYSTVFVFKTDGCCEAPGTITANAITATTASVNFTTVLAANSYNLRYREQGTTTWTNLTGVNAANTQLQGLDSCTVYELEIQTVCDTGATAFAAAVIFQTTDCPGCRVAYCALGSDDASEEWIDSVTVNTLTNGSGSNGGYGDFTNSSFTTTLTQGGTYNLRLVPGYNGFVFDEYFRIWIDLNNDGDFSDALEQIYDSGNGVNGPITGSFTLPSNGVTGGTRMRVAMRYDNAPVSCGSNFDFGEVEDYCVDILPQVVGIPDSRLMGMTAYPNPFQDRLQVSFDLQFLADVHLELFDLLGERVAGAEYNALHSGQHDLSLETSELPEGVYLLNLRAGDRSETIKVILMNQ